MIGLQEQNFLLRAKKDLPERVDEATFKLNPKKKGMWKGKGIGAIEKAKTLAKKSGNVTKEREATFAINAKHHFRKEETELDEGKKTEISRFWKNFGRASKKTDKDLKELKQRRKADKTKKEETEVDEAHTTHQLRQAQELHNRARTDYRFGTRKDRQHAKASSIAQKLLFQRGKRDANQMNIPRGPNEDEIFRVKELGENEMEIQNVSEDGKTTLGPVRIKPDTAPGEVSAQGHGKKKLGPDGFNHASSADPELVAQGHGKIPVRGEICREDVQELIAASLDDKPAEAIDSFNVAIQPLLQDVIGAYKEHIQSQLLGVEEAIEAEEVDDDEEVDMEALEEAWNQFLSEIDFDELDEEVTEDDLWEAFLETLESDEGEGGENAEAEEQEDKEVSE